MSGTIRILKDDATNVSVTIDKTFSYNSLTRDAHPSQSGQVVPEAFRLVELVWDQRW